MDILKEYIYKQVAARNLNPDAAKSMLNEIQLKSRDEDDIAIIGMATRLPGAKNTSEYWDNLEKGRICIGHPPQSRKSLAVKSLLVLYLRQLQDNKKYVLDRYLEFLKQTFKVLNETDIEHNDNLIADLEYPGLSEVMGGYVDDIDKFDAGFFRIPPREALFMEPIHKVFLETVWEAIEDSGYANADFIGSNTAVFVGRDNVNGTNKFKELVGKDDLVTTGTWPGLLAGRISYLFNLRGPGLVIDTACSAGLVSVHQACKALKNKECTMAIAAGVSGLNFAPSNGDSTLSSVESSDSTVRSFDKYANGTVWGEGVGVIMLKPLSRAIADGDNIHAVIKGSAINNDGASNGITAPNAEAQEEVIIKAWKDAGVKPETIQYIEAHGTGTILGDPIEIKGITNAFRKYTDKKQFCAIGSVKSSIGHLVGASGMAALIKVVLSLKEQKIPATMNFTSPNPYINFNESPVYINDRLSNWEKLETPRRGGVSAFGFMGTNCHVIVEEAPKKVKKMEETASERSIPELFTLSAKSESALEELVNSYISYISKHRELSLQDISFTANSGRGHYNYRIAIVTNDLQDLREKLVEISDKGLKNLISNRIYYGQHKVVPGNKKVKAPGEINEDEKQKMTNTAKDCIKNLLLSENDQIKLILNEICKLYIRGAEIDWKELYRGTNRNRVSLPTYPFEKIQLWPQISDFNCKELLNKKSEVNSEIDKMHTLVHRCLADSMSQQIYVTEFKAETHWVLNEHRILKNYVIPGVTFLEMAREASKKYLKGENFELFDVLFLTPVIVKEEETKEVQTIITKGREYLEFSIVSAQNNNGDLESQWIKHAEGKIRRCADYKFGSYDISTLIDDFNNADKDSQSILLTKTVKKEDKPIQVGPRWVNSEKLYINNNKVLFKLKLPEEFCGDLEEFYLHPSLLDNAVNLISQKVGEGMYLPLFYRSLKVCDRLPREFYSYTRIKDKTSINGETASFDITLIDMQGRVIAEVEDYKIKKVNQAEFKFKELKGNSIEYFRTTWAEKNVDTSSATLSGESILIFKDEEGISTRLSALLKNSGNEVIEVEFGSEYVPKDENKYVIGPCLEDYKLLMQAVKHRNIRKIVNAATISTVEFSRIEEQEEMNQKGVYNLFNLTKALLETKYKQDIDIILISNNICKVTSDESVINPNGAPLFGLGKVVGEEYGNLKCRCIDIDILIDPVTLLNELSSQKDYYQVAYRNGKRYIPEFTKQEITEEQGEDLKIKENGVYVITGGLGGLGLEMCKYLTSEKNVKLCLINRTEFPERSDWEAILEYSGENKQTNRIRTLKALEDSGSEVKFYRADISSYKEAETAFNKIKQDFGKITGIIHCAGVAGDGFLMKKDFDIFQNVIRPKVNGTWIIDRLTENEKLDFFVVFSSVATIMGLQGQGDYTAANSYLNSFADYRSLKGNKTVAINWPAWEETGMADDYGAKGNKLLLKPIKTTDAIYAFSKVVDSQYSNIILGELNYNALSAFENKLPFKLSPQLFQELQRQKARLTENAGIKEERKQIVATLIGKDEYNKIEYTLGQIWANVLGITEIDIYENFSNLGGDSIMATQLLKGIEQIYPGAIDISDVFSYPSVVQMAEFMNNNIKSISTDAESVEKSSTVYTDDNLKQMIDAIESGEASIESALEALSNN